jgi:L,D-transpeptidase ErfK/SrfK
MTHSQSLLLSLLLLAFTANPALASYRQVVEEDFTYKAVKGDYLCKISGMNGLDCSRLLKENPRDPDKVRVGETFRITRRTIVPEAIKDGIVINIPDRTLYLFRDGRLVAHYPLGIGKRTWQTPLGAFTVKSKRLKPTWRVPVSIQKEMARKGEPVKTVVPPCKENPLGDFAVGLSIQGVLIHSTIWPESVYGFRSHGCLRLKPADAEAFYKAVDKGDRGIIIYEPVKLARTENGRVFLEVHQDVYGKTGDLLAEAERQIKEAGLSDLVDSEKVSAVALAAEGVAADVTRRFSP